MQILDDPAAFRRALDRDRERGAGIGLVPTMGALHAGHRSLVARAVVEQDHAAVSIFVNPRQFDRPEDLASYPRTLDEDLRVCEEAGVETVFVPATRSMFPPESETTVSVATLGSRWEGASRPGHFDGVATVVTKLLSLAGACRAYFGEKDFQQLAVVRRLVADLAMPVHVVGCPTVRDADGLALSSRNVRLSVEAREAASVLWRALGAGRAAVAAGEVRPEAVASAMAAEVATRPLVRLDYAAAVDADDLTVPRTLAELRAVRLLVAAEVGGVRLIDNCAAPRPFELGAAGVGFAGREARTTSGVTG